MCLKLFHIFCLSFLFLVLQQITEDSNPLITIYHLR